MDIFDSLRPGDDIVVSASSFTAYRRCPGLAEARYRGIFGKDTQATFSGGLAHRVFARHLVHGAIDAADFEQVCRSEIGSSNLNNKLGPLEMKPSKLAGVIAEVGALYERFTKFPTDGFQGAEVSLDNEPVSGVLLRGVIDAIFDDDGSVRLVDWKTGELHDAELQLGFYALLWSLARDEIPGRVEAISVRTGERLLREPTAADVEGTGREVVHMINSLRTSWNDKTEAPRTGGPWCRYCPLLEDCGEGQTAMETLGETQTP